MNAEKEQSSDPDKSEPIASLENNTLDETKTRSSGEIKSKSYELSKIMIATPEQIDAKLAKLKGILPSLLLSKLSESLKMTRVTESQCDEIIMKTVDQFQSSGNANQTQMTEISQKLENLDNSIISLVQFLEHAYSAGANLASKQEKEQNTPQTIENKPAIANNPVQEKEQNTPAIANNPVQEKSNNPPETDCIKNKVMRPSANSHVSGGKQPAKLTHIDNKIENEIVLLKWIEFLLERVGRENLPRTLEFYENIKWINDEMTDKILTYARGVNVSQEERVYAPELSVKDHIQSLLFIEKLRGCEVDKQSIVMLEKEVVAIKRGSEGIYGI